ncbi:hypothetical protein [Nocardioides dongkuii]|uniref:hypothetical protein n=1 Tax=Nocardioides dongkuii TaxID=2760089 RepID=UPI001878F611|nr:hypothetical protein [Nocardioides dongkuii]
MTEDDQLPFNGSSDDQDSQLAPDAVMATDPGATEPKATEDIDHGDEQGIPATPGLDGVGDEQNAKLPAAQQVDDVQAPAGFEGVAAEPAEALAAAKSAESVTTSEERASGALYFLTNRMNLNGVLSSRLVAPRESFQKYYADLLALTPGWVPLLRQAPTSRQIDAVTSERGAGAPIIVEFSPEVAGKSKSDASVVYVPAVALSAAVAIHLPSERDLREHRARGYSNVHAHDDLLRVTPELFESEAADPANFKPPNEPADIDWRRIDRIRGAVSAAVTAASTGEQLALVAAMIGASKVPAAFGRPPWLGWAELDDHLRPDSRSRPDSALPDHLVFRAVYDVLGERDVAEAWSPNDVLDAVEARVRQAALTTDATDAMVRNLSRVRSIVNVEVDFEPFRPSTQALVSAKALLLLLLRQELDQLLAWSDDETGADDATRGVAAVLAGRLRGLSRESTALRSVELDDLTAAWAVRVARGGSTKLGKAQFVANGRGTSLRIDGVEVATRGALLPDLMSKYKKVAEAKKEATRVRVSRAMGWPVEHRIQLPQGALIDSRDTLLSIYTPEEVVLTVAVEEIGFVRRLESLAGGERLKAAGALAARR